MNILVLNGSPKGEYSITLQTVRYLEAMYPKHTWNVLHVGQRIKSMEKDFSKVLGAVWSADLLLFSYPVYTFLAPSQLHRFIELLKASGMDFSGKFAAQLTTSKHFYDITAHRYIQDNCQDLNLKYIGGLSADMDDLLTEKGRQDARQFFDHICWSISRNSYVPCPPSLQPAVPQPVIIPETSSEEKSGDVVIITECHPEDTQLQAMIDRFRAVLPLKTRVFNLLDYPFHGGCLGCFHCAVDGTCVYKDGFDRYLRENLQTAQSMIYAFTIRDHSMGALFKTYDDRQFCNGHRTVTMGMPVGYLISGAYSREHNLQTVVEARSQVGSNFLAGVATDEVDPNGQIDRLAANLTYALEHSYRQPQNFYGIGGMKVFRDLIWLMQGMMKADHKFYKSHGQYDFPQKQWPTMVKMYLVGTLLASPKLKSKLGNKMNEGMIAPYRKVLQSIQSKTE